MSNKWIDVVVGNPEPSGPRRIVLLILANRANDAGTCYPSVKTIARESALSQRSANRILAELRGEYLEIHIGKGMLIAGTKNRTNLYRLLCPPRTPPCQK